MTIEIAAWMGHKAEPEFCRDVERLTGPIRRAGKPTAGSFGGTVDRRYQLAQSPSRDRLSGTVLSRSRV